jgi:flavin reductase (DIM6/NTAB) family NADH-FMN oxidoreductase RutF
MPDPAEGVLPGSAAAWFLEQLWAPIVAVTAADGGRANGLISSTALSSSLIPEAPRVSLHLSKHNLTHDLVLASRAFAIHLLPADEVGLALFRALGTSSGHTHPKLVGVATRPGKTGSPILVDAVSYLEARVVSMLDAEELTIALADVVAAGGAANAPFLTIEHVRERLSADDMRAWERRYQAEVEAARRMRRVTEAASGQAGAAGTQPSRRRQGS